MLKTKLRILTCLMAVMYIIVCASCSRKIETTKDSTNNQRIAGEALQYGTDILFNDIAGHGEDAKDIQLNEAVLNLTLALKDVLTNQTVTTKIVTQINSTIGKQQTLSNVTQAVPELTVILNGRLAQLIPDFATKYGGNWENYAKIFLLYDAVQYEPMLNLGNSQPINIAGEVKICAGLGINEEKFPEFDDNIPCWYQTATGPTSFTTIDAAYAYNSTDPIIILDNGLTGEDVFVPRVDPGKNNKNSRGSTDALKHSDFKINHAYEGLSKIDYTVDVVLTLAQDKDDINKTQRTLVQAPKITKVSKSSVGTNLTANFDIASDAVLSWPAGTNFTFNPAKCSPKYFGIISYEHDWWASKKLIDVEVCQKPGVVITAQPYNGRLKYVHEWYHFDPLVWDKFDILSLLPTNGSTTTVSNSKGFMKITRTW
jgi:hypothetical protein